jgi:hypothetical protein
MPCIKNDNIDPRISQTEAVVAKLDDVKATDWEHQDAEWDQIVPLQPPDSNHKLQVPEQSKGSDKGDSMRL